MATGLIRELVASLFAGGCFLLVIGMVLQSAGRPARRLGRLMIGIPVAGCIFFGALEETLQKYGVTGGSDATASTIIGFIFVSVIAFIVLQVRRTFQRRDNRSRFQIREKRPIDPTKRGADLVSFLRDQLRRDDE